MSGMVYAEVEAEPELVTLESTVEADIVFTITGESEYGNWLFLSQWIPVTDADLLTGVSAVDEIGDPVDVIVVDVGGLSLTSPQPQGGFPPSPYIITYGAIHPVTGELYTTTREAFVTAGIMPLASTDTVIDLSDPNNATYSSTSWSYDSVTNTYTITAGANVTLETTSPPATTATTIIMNTGATVTSTATLSGSSAASLLTIAGSGGTFLATSGSISNAGAGNAINVTGAAATITLDNITVSNTGAGSAISIANTATGATVNLDNGANVFSGSSGNGITINANNVKVYVNSGSMVESLGNNLNAAIQIGSGSTGVSNTQIMVAGGAVTSTNSGYAINDSIGTGTTTTNTDTHITIQNGIVTAGSNSAIYSTSTRSPTNSGAIVYVNGGIVSNAAGNNLNPAININATSGSADDSPGVIVNGGTVASTSNAGYALQSTGNISVIDGTVTAINGRAINLVGMNAIFNMTGGVVQATGTGTAISSATTNPSTATGASVWVSGGTISANSGSAIQVTGSTSSVMIVGGTITSTSGNAINATSDAVNAHIAVNGSTIVSSVSGNAINAATNTSGTTNQTVYVGGNTQISSVTGRAIQTNGRGSSVEVNNNSQVWVLNNGNAIRSSGTVTVNSGFIFAYGPSATSPYFSSFPSANANNVISAASPSPMTVGADALVVAWYPSASSGGIYPQGPTNPGQLDLGNSYNGDYTNYWWSLSPSQGSGIAYSIGTGTGSINSFFPLSQVTVTMDFGLIFDASNGRLYENTSGYPLAPGSTGPNPLWSSNQVSTSPANYNLNLNGFSWATSYPAALTVINGPTTIFLSGDNYFETTSTAIGSAGILAEPEVTSLTIENDGSYGALTAVGGEYGIRGQPTRNGQEIIFIDENLSMQGITMLTAQGSIDAINFTTFTNNAQVYTFWTNNVELDPGGPGTFYAFGISPNNTPYSYTALGVDKFVRLMAGPGAVISDVEVKGTVNQGLGPPIYTAIISLFDVDPISDNLGFVNSWFDFVPNGVNVLADWNPDGSISLEFSGIPRQTANEIFNITIPGSILGLSEDLVVIINLGAFFLIYGNESNTSGSSSSPDTSDSRNIEGWTTSLLLSAIGLLCILVWIRLRKPWSQKA